ncbi:MAG: SDR family NAD(P)-dependent oxidoreductase [Hyphomicrobiaceae bacterium]|nr:SDR family NAD(P)-dependent oxidoreductase [Hyphomicrobiaceae bacterium]
MTATERQRSGAGLPRTILITGASSGIGLATARALKSRGWRVLATARKPDDLDRLRAEEGLEPIPLELADPASVAACADTALRLADGRLDALFNNAAYGQVGAVEDITADLLRRQLEVNVIGGHELTRRIIPAMRRARAGRIVNCSSVLGLVSGPYRGAYSASKFALEALSDALRIELSGTGIHVSLIEPGPIRTKFLESALAAFESAIDWRASPHREIYERRLAAMRAGGKQGFKLEPEAVAAKVVDAVESRYPKPRYFVTAPTYAADGMRRILPTRLLDRMLRDS